jgi:hypothetical protein
LHVFIIHYPSCTDSIQPGLQFSCNFVVINASEGSFFSKCVYFTTAGVKVCVAAVKSCTVLHFSVVILFWSFGIIDATTIKCLELSTAQAGAMGAWGVLQLFIIPHVQTQSKRVCNSLVSVLWLTLPIYHFVSRSFL